MKGNNKMKKKILSLALAMLCMGACLVGCGDTDESENEGKSESYIEKKIATMNSASSSLQKAFCASLMDLESTNGTDIYSISGWIELSDWDWEKAEEPDSDAAVLNADNAEELLSHYVQLYFSDVVKLDSASVYVNKGEALGACCTADGEYCGTYPDGLITYADYENSGKIDMQECMDRVEEKIK